MEGNNGCGIAGLALAGLVVLALAVVVIDGAARYEDAQASRLYAEAAVVAAQGQARLDSAQAFAVTTGALFPWLIVGVVGVAGAVLLAAIVAMFWLGLAAIRGQPAALPWGRVQVIDQPALVLPRLEGPARDTAFVPLDREVRR